MPDREDIIREKKLLRKKCEYIYASKLQERKYMLSNRPAKCSNTLFRLKNTFILLVVKTVQTGSMLRYLLIIGMASELVGMLSATSRASTE